MRDTPVQIAISGGYQSLDAFVFARMVTAADGWSEALSAHIDSAMTWPDLLKAVSSQDGFSLNTNVDKCCALFDVTTAHGRAVVKVENWGDTFAVDAVGQTRESATATIEALKVLIPERTYDDAEVVPVSFWSFDPMHAGTRFVRELPRLNWADVQQNYPASVRAKLDVITKLETAPDNGRLFVFHGPPGTGKSRLLQTLASEWASWCDVSYIVDSDMFFGNAQYMTKVMLGNRDSDRWRLVVAEDSDEFIDAHSKAKTGQGSARLLNIADGLVGQGLKVMVLASTNVNAARFSKAVIRPGRCAAMIEFPAFPPEEADAWVAEAGIDHEGFTTPATLADLYALRSGTML